MKFKRISTSLVLGLMSLFIIGTAQQTRAASLERFLVTSVMGAGLGQAIGRDTESTLMGAAAAVILDGYFKPDFMGDHPITSHLPGFQPIRQVSHQPVYYRTQPTRYVVERPRPAGKTVTTTTTTTSFAGESPSPRQMRSHYKRHARRHQREVRNNEYVRYENPDWW